MARTSSRESITVILPVRNGAATLARAVRSTLAALPGDGTLLVHDDASSDETPRVLAGVADARLRVLRSEEPRGIAGGLNHLLEHVKTPVVARMDADDVTLPWRFQIQRRTLAAGADVVFSTVIGFGDVSLTRLATSPPIGISAAAMPLHLLLANPVAHSTMLARTEALRAIGGYRLVPAEDYDLWLRLCGAGWRLARSGFPCLLYRFHPGQVTASAQWQAQACGNSEVRDVYAELSRRVLRREPDWYDDLRDRDHNEDARSRLRVLDGAVTAAAATLGPVQQRLLLAKLHSFTGLPSATARPERSQ